ncbi:HTH-type transcriptional regulator CdhR [Zhongshania aliphaticivorans]|uniref:HTH-type transcriptional regulator CdhR n=1 Tax=Zhongshania aliphaticivorans TaxID=1470434 RepID=A0A5S9N537_9GAMM|nr:helix-turn-helix domain-containing protein [Zhongshania aliphaticivorans]CAA0081871.1 HTH-type transcriptional regulator CdhR [Zhongshania aliphaticivorans]CAA0084616.1 HTH-type transcriptional regulator CdhR [Zhongshania aliphaticivorans]
MEKLEWRVALVAYEGAWSSAIYNTLDMLQSANLRNIKKVFSWNIVTPEAQAITSYSGQPIYGDMSMADSDCFDCIILPHYWDRLEHTVNQNPDIIVSWLLRQRQSGASIASINSGVLWAAEAGLLNSLRATAFWRQLPELRKRYPEVVWIEKQGLVEDGDIFSSNGPNAAIDLVVHLISKFCGPKLASGVAADMTCDTRRSYDLTLFNMAGFRQHHDSGIYRVQDWLDEHFNDPVEFHQLATQSGMSKSTFLRRFQKATGEKPAQYLQRLRVESAKHKLVNTNDNIKTVSMGVGYQNFSHFSKVFKQLTGASPRQYRERFRRHN